MIYGTAITIVEVGNIGEMVIFGEVSDPLTTIAFAPMSIVFSSRLLECTDGYHIHDHGLRTLRGRHAPTHVSDVSRNLGSGDFTSTRSI